ncbi:MAG TPA: type II/IV secretion system protein [Candidatus Onthousia faecavium]|nr:type II/IV secretion system protein [Candidatus Onthousia faecavium]
MVSYDMTKLPIVEVVDDIIANASKAGASDIHFDPREDFLMVRIRIDGDLQDYTTIPKIYERNLITRIKLLSNMNITESRLPQDGSIKGNIKGINLETRVSTLPTNEGEKCVIRILDYTRSLEGIESLGFNKENFEKLKRMIAEPNGIILITGATGSGKSTTVYSILQVLNKKETNIITVEDPIEMNIEGLNQVQVNSEIGLDFATVLRSILRQDPNIILIGEIRDSETAKIAVRASITGHLVLSTIHTNNSLSTIERLLDMNVERYLLSSALSGIISQKLAKMLCPECRIKEKASAYQKKVFKLALNKDIDELYTANPKGCPKCNNGYHGRIALQEVLLINDEIRNALNVQDLDKKDLNKLVYGSDVITLLQDGLLKVLDGSTSFDEIYKLIDVDDDLDAYCEIKGITYDEHNGQIIKLNDNTNKQKNDIIEKEEILKNKNEEEEVL